MTFTMSFWLLVVIFTRLANLSSSKARNPQTRPRRFWVHDVLRRRDDLGEYARLVQELGLDSDRLYRYFRMSTEQFDYMFCGWWDHTFHVYQLCMWLCMYRDVRVVRRRMTSYAV